MICPNCGIMLPSEAQFCGECGTCLKNFADPFAETHPDPHQPPPQQMQPHYPPNYGGYGFGHYAQPRHMTRQKYEKTSCLSAFIMTLVAGFIIYSSFLLLPLTVLLAIPATILGAIGLVQGAKGRAKKLPYHLGSIIMGITVLVSCLFGFVLSIVVMGMAF